MDKGERRRVGLLRLTRAWRTVVACDAFRRRQGEQPKKKSVGLTSLLLAIHNLTVSRVSVSETTFGWSASVHFGPLLTTPRFGPKRVSVLLSLLDKEVGLDEAGGGDAKS